MPYVPYVGTPYVGFSGSCDDCEELVDRPALELDDAPDRFALDVDDVADSFRKAPRTSFSGSISASVEPEVGAGCKNKKNHLRQKRHFCAQT